LRAVGRPGEVDDVIVEGRGPMFRELHSPQIECGAKRRARRESATRWKKGASQSCGTERPPSPQASRPGRGGTRAGGETLYRRQECRRSLGRSLENVQKTALRPVENAGTKPAQSPKKNARRFLSARANRDG
jgi:hypothetical protein